VRSRLQVDCQSKSLRRNASKYLVTFNLEPNNSAIRAGERRPPLSKSVIRGAYTAKCAHPWSVHLRFGGQVLRWLCFTAHLHLEPLRTVGKGR